MSKLSIKNNKLALEILETYIGDNPYIKMIKNNVLIKKSQATDFELNYVLKNHDYKPVEINKIVKITDEFGEKKREYWKYDHEIKKLQIVTLLGETSGHWHCYINYSRKQVKPVMCFIPKKDLLDSLENTDYDGEEIDFEKYNKILSKIDRQVLDHQKDAVKFFLGKQKKVILADEQGLTKTASTIMSAIEGKFKKILIISPSSIKINWQEELEFLGESKENSCIINSNKWISGKKWTIINYDILENHHKLAQEEINGKLKNSRKKAIIEEALKNSNLYNEGFDLVIIDEAHKLSNYKSIRSEMISDYLKKSKMENLWLLTGTPINSDTKSFFNLLSLISHPLASNWEYYMERYCGAKKITVKKTGKDIWITAKEGTNLEELQAKVSDCYLRREKKELPGMVKKIIHQIYYELTEDEMREYEQLWDEYEIAQRELGKTEFNKELNSLILLRLFISEKMCKNTIKLAEEFLKIGEKVFILTSFTREVEILKEHFGDRSVQFIGGKSIKQKNDAVNKFNKDPSTTVFIGNIIASGTGINLYEGGHITIFNSFDWSQSSNNQALDRQHRVGQMFDVDIYFQLFKNTISEDMWKTVLRKQLTSDAIIKSEIEK